MSEPVVEFPQRPPRKPMVANLEIFRSGSKVGTARTRNVSKRGVGGTGFIPFLVDQKVVIVVDGAERISARIVWQDGAQFGLELEQTLEVEDFAMATTLSGDRRPL